MVLLEQTRGHTLLNSNGTTGRYSSNKEWTREVSFGGGRFGNGALAPPLPSMQPLVSTCIDPSVLEMGHGGPQDM